MLFPDNLRITTDAVKKEYLKALIKNLENGSMAMCCSSCLHSGCNLIAAVFINLCIHLLRYACLCGLVFFYATYISKAVLLCIMSNRLP